MNPHSASLAIVRFTPRTSHHHTLNIILVQDPALERRFQQVYVDQPSVEDTISILRGLRERYELHHGVRISYSALVAAAILSDRYISGRFLPDKGNAYMTCNSLRSFKDLLKVGLLM